MGEALSDKKLNKQRIQWVDTARAIGIFLIVLGHTFRGGDVRQFAFSFHVPLFFFLSGFVFTGSGECFKSFFFKKVKTIIVPYLFFAFVSLVIFYFLGSIASVSLDINVKTFSWLKYTLGIFYGSGNTGYLKTNLPLWFLPCFFVFNVLMYFCQSVIGKFSSKFKQIEICILVFFIVISSVNIIKLRIYKLPFGAETAVNMLPFGLLGAYFRRNESKIKSFINKKILNHSVKNLIGILAVCVLALIIYIFGVRLNEAVIYYINLYGYFPYYCVTALCGIGLVYLISNFIPHFKFVSYIAKNTMSILTMHKFPILFFQIVIPFTSKYIESNNVLICVIVALITIFMCLAVGQVILKICPWIFGKPYKKP